MPLPGVDVFGCPVQLFVVLLVSLISVRGRERQQVRRPEDVGTPDSETKGRNHPLYFVRSPSFKRLGALFHIDSLCGFFFFPDENRDARTRRNTILVGV